MPQVFQVLKCYKCLVFQIHQTKKSNKFDCKMCGEKQSIKRHYGIGTGKDCRLHVQRLNSLRGEMEETTTIINSADDIEDSKSDEQTIEKVKNTSNSAIKRSRWSAFVDKEEKTTEDGTNEPMFLGDKEVILEKPQKKKSRKFKVKLNSSSNLEDDLNTSKNTYSCNSETNWGANDIVDLESGSFLKSIQDSHHNYSHKNYEYDEQVKMKHNNETIGKKEQYVEQEMATISINSKWAQFVDTKDEVENKDTNSGSMFKGEHSSTLLTKTENLFSLCDDGDLDEVLDF